MTGLASGLATRPAPPGSKLRSHLAEWLGELPGKGLARQRAKTAGLLAGQLPGWLGWAGGGSPAGREWLDGWLGQLAYWLANCQEGWVGPGGIPSWKLSSPRNKQKKIRGFHEKASFAL